MQWQPVEETPQTDRLFAIVCERYASDDNQPPFRGAAWADVTYESSLEIALFQHGKWHTWVDDEGQWTPGPVLFTHWMPVPNRPD
jgi:hypothetical protein